jgi:TDG/mug DNA glycosylase family protein
LDLPGVNDFPNPVTRSAARARVMRLPRTGTARIMADGMGNKARRRLPNALALPDVLSPGLDVVFVGTAAGTASAAKRQYYAGPGNGFWLTLRKIGLTDRRFQPSEFRELLACGIGLTDIAKTASGADVDIGREHYDARTLRSNVRRYRPRALAFNGKNAAQHFYGTPVEYGRQQDLDDTAVFVLPSTSGAARGFWDIRPWRELAAFVKR